MNDRRAAFEEEHRLLQLSREGDLGAYGALFEKHRGPSVSYAYRFARQGIDPEDLVQDAFMTVMETIGRGKGPTVSMGHYVRTTIRTMAMRRAKSPRSQEIPIDTDALAALFEEQAFDDEEHQSDWLIEGFNHLTHRQQYVVWEHVIERRSLRSIAPELGVSPATALRTYHQAMKDLRTRFARASAAASADPTCITFVAALLDDGSDDQAFTEHLAGCASCRAIRRRLASRDRAIMSVILVSGLGELGVSATSMSWGAAVTGWFASLAAPAQVAVVAVPIALLAVGGSVLAQAGGSSAPGAAHGTAVQITRGDAAGSPALAALGECAVVRDVASDAREAWRLIGGVSCGMQVDYFDPASSLDGVSLLDTRATPSRLTVEIAHPGHYAVTLHDRTASGPATTTLAIDVR